MWSFTRLNLTRIVGGLLFVALLLSAACQGSPDPLAADAQSPNISSHAAGEGYVGPAETHGNAGSSGSFPFGGGATGGSETGSAAGGGTTSSAAAGGSQANAAPQATSTGYISASPAPSPQ